MTLETTMITIEARQVQLHTNATNKQDAIRQVGQLLVNSGCIEAGYITSMLGREQVANKYLGNGIAIPHGLPEDSEMSLLQLGVTPGSTIHVSAQGTDAAIKDGQAVVKDALASVAAGPTPAAKTDYVAQVQAAKAARSKTRRGPYKHLLTGVSYMIPFVVAGGILIALAFAIGGYRIAFYDTSDITVLTTGFAANPAQSIGAALFVIGAKAVL